MYRYIRVPVIIYLLKDICVTPFWQLGVKLLQTFVCVFLYKFSHLYSK